jgi:hypothetical protein
MCVPTLLNLFDSTDSNVGVGVSITSSTVTDCNFFFHHPVQMMYYPTLC